MAAGGALGAGARYLVVSRYPTALPWGTLTVNVSGAFLLGMALTLLAERFPRWQPWQPFLCTGVLGAGVAGRRRARGGLRPGEPDRRARRGPAGRRGGPAAVTGTAVAGVMLAGAMGAVARSVVDAAVSRRARGAFPWGTFVINVTGSLALGAVAGWRWARFPGP